LTEMGFVSSLKITVLAEDSVQYESPLLGQHGISFFVEARKDGFFKRILIDVAQNPTALLHNMTLLGIEPCGLDGIVLTHCHYDHTQGLVEILKAAGKKDLPVIAHPESFRLHFITDPYLRHVGFMAGDSRAKIEEAGGLLFLSRDPLQIMPGLLCTGEVPRLTDFEQVGIPLKTIVEGRVVEDAMRDDVSVIARVRDKGTVTITGCSHAGIVNIVKHATVITGENRVCGIVGGFHLLQASEERIGKTVDALYRHNPQWISAGHCTGFRAQVALYERFKERFRPLQTGMRFEV
jgi:7,8-dihydropterin-6-yl-methyl-4-(beta-D-ribofuranosyl)aminobenzene 5'-phosphate synthase